MAGNLRNVSIPAHRCSSLPLQAALNRSSRDRFQGPTPSNPTEIWEEGGRCRQTIALRSPGVGVFMHELSRSSALSSSSGSALASCRMQLHNRTRTVGSWRYSETFSDKA